MKLNTLKIFIKLCDIGSYSQVAEEMNLTQPAVSMQVKALEEYFETELINKSKGTIYLTEAGKILYRQSREILRRWDKAELEISQLLTKDTGRIKVGASTIPGVYFLPDKLANFRESYSNIKVDVISGDSQDMIEALTLGKVDLIIIGKKLNSDKYLAEPVEDDQLKYIVGVEHPLADKGEIELSELIKYDLVVREEGSGTRKVMLDAFRELGYSLKDFKVSFQFGSTEAVISAVESGLGNSFVSRMAASKAEKSDRVKIIETPELNLSRHLYLIYEKGRLGENIMKSFHNNLID